MTTNIHNEMMALLRSNDTALPIEDIMCYKHRTQDELNHELRVCQDIIHDDEERFYDYVAAGSENGKTVCLHLNGDWLVDYIQRDEFSDWKGSWQMTTGQHEDGSNDADSWTFAMYSTDDFPAHMTFEEVETECAKQAIDKAVKISSDIAWFKGAAIAAACKPE